MGVFPKDTMWGGAARQKTSMEEDYAILAATGRGWHPGGMQDISRWLSAAMPPDVAPPSLLENPGRGSGHVRFLLASGSRTPAGVPGMGRSVQSRWCRCAQPPANGPHPSGVKRDRTPRSTACPLLHGPSPRLWRSANEGGRWGRPQRGILPRSSGQPKAQRTRQDAASTSSALFAVGQRTSLRRRAARRVLRRVWLVLRTARATARREPTMTTRRRPRVTAV